jgi:methylated-DNA-protein-cysteine methyltransferase-like protein
MTFSERVLKIALSIPKGRVTTYGRIARAAGGGGQSARSITSILGKAYENGATNIPFHRIVYSDGTAWMNDTYRVRRMKLYREEGIALDEKDRIKDFRKVVFEFK